ncbi:MAG: SUMF1/EgtB/PvdO family nonheme iron enzyme [Planctomycetota bacterium]
MRKCMTIAAAAAAVLVCASGARADFAFMDTVSVGNVGNAGELSGVGAGGSGEDRICGAVGYAYNIGKYEVTAGQYTDFLNAVADTDTYELYKTAMWENTTGCKIQRSGDPGGYTYSVAGDWADRPVNMVSFWSAARFANWLHNGRPAGAQGPDTTEDGAYTLDGYTESDGSWIMRKPGATWCIPSEDEWYKAAYYDGDASIYYDYPTGTDAVPSNDLVDPDPGNNANFDQDGFTIGHPYYRTEVGEFENSASPYGTFDQGGNVWEWHDNVVYGSHRGSCGGGWYGDDTRLHAARRGASYPTTASIYTGFRVAYVPEPATLSLLLLGGFVVRRRRR